MADTNAYAAMTAGATLAPFQIERRAPGSRDVVIDIEYCGICHTDIHMTRGDFPGQVFPLVPGHEIVGRVRDVGDRVCKYTVGDRVGVGCLIDSCGECSECRGGLEQFCDRRITTYGRYEKDGVTPAYGGYSTSITVNEDFVVGIDPALQPAAAAPLLCAGITTYSALRHWGVGSGTAVAIAGLGGLGHVAVKLAAAMGAEVTVLSTSDRKHDDALRLGAHGFVVTRDPAELAGHVGRFDLILNTVSADIDLDGYVKMLGRDGTLVMLGVSGKPLPVNAMHLLQKRKSIAASPIGGLRETQEMLDFCATHGIGADVEVISIDDVNKAYDRVLSSDVRYRFVIDVNSMR